MIRPPIILLISFVLNALWENIHSVLYASRAGKAITEIVLLHAAFKDALIVTAISLPFLFCEFLKKRDWLIMIIGIIVSAAIELYSLRAGRWTYNELMPIIPLAGIGLTPALELGLTGYISYRFSLAIKSNNLGGGGKNNEKYKN